MEIGNCTLYMLLLGKSSQRTPLVIIDTQIYFALSPNDYAPLESLFNAWTKLITGCLKIFLNLRLVYNAKGLKTKDSVKNLGVTVGSD